MTEQTVMLGKRKFILLPERDFRRWQAKAGLGAVRTKRAVRAVRKPQRTLKEMHAWMSEHWDEVMEKAKENTRKLTGRDTL